MTNPQDSPRFDVAVIGAGVVGCAIARALSHYQLNVALIEASDDVGTGTSKANSAILHTGFDAPVGSLEARLVRRGHSLLVDYAGQVGIPLVKTGAVLIAWTGDDTVSLDRIKSVGEENGYDAISALTAEQVYALEPHLGPGVVAGLHIPDESIICPFTTPLALATEAMANGVTLLRNSPVRGAVRGENGTWSLDVGDTGVMTDWVINAAGLHGDSLAEMLGDSPFQVAPRRGQFVVFDKVGADLVSSIILGVPSPRSKGVLLAPTVFGNLLLGPTAEDVEAKDATETTGDGLGDLLRQGAAIVPALAELEVTSTYSGLRAVSSKGGYDIEVDAERRSGRASGIRSTGLSASLAIAELMLEELADAGLELRPRGDRQQVSMAYIGEELLRPHRDEAAIADNPDAGRVVCFCELTTLAELEAAAASPIPPATVDGIRRRTRATGGRCQGFYCRAQVTTWLAAKSGKGPAELLGTVAGR